ncbi:MAG: VCBS repeat-containing protein [Bryobacterales bacterium]|nr:VCBS repeat-containing protein [Bryobacterales bacterium]
MVRVAACLIPTLLFAVGLAAAPWERHTIDASGEGADGVRVADVNGDGLPDIATPWEQSGHVRAYLHPGAGKAAGEWPAVTVGTVTSPEDAVFADMDGDGRFEVVSSTEGDEKTVYIHQSSGDSYLDPAGWETRAVTRSVGKNQWMFAHPMDVDGNGSMDLVAGSKNDFAAIGAWRFPTSAGGRASWSRWYGAGWVMSILAHDMNGDGAPDIVASDRKGPRRGALWFQNMPGSAAWPVVRIGTEGEHESMFLDVADLDGDGQTDVVMAVKGGPIQFFRSTSARGNRWRTHPISVPPGFGTGKAVAVGDMDQDGDADIVFTCEGAEGDLSGVGLLSNSGDATASEWEATDVGGPQGTKFDRIELLDLDGDGDLDILTSEEADGLGVVWYENPAR